METSQELEWVPTADVRPGDRLACLLSDAEAYPEVTGWSDRELKLSRFGLADVTHREFTVSGAPWWVDMSDRAHDLNGEALIVKRGTYRAGVPVLRALTATMRGWDA